MLEFAEGGAATKFWPVDGKVVINKWSQVLGVLVAGNREQL
jgi:hypothetical protein